jgi:hypothetical protein
VLMIPKMVTGRVLDDRQGDVIGSMLAKEDAEAMSDMF